MTDYDDDGPNFTEWFETQPHKHIRRFHDWTEWSWIRSGQQIKVCHKCKKTKSRDIKYSL